MANNKPKKRRKIWLIIVAAVLVLSVLCSAVYISDYYHASEAAMAVLEQDHSPVSIIRRDHRIDFIPEHAAAGFIFYPGGKVQFEAYAPLLELLAERGILCVMPHMPGNLSVLDINAADGIQADYPEIQDWYLGGHSLGGTCAAQYLYEHADEYDYRGLILLAAYSTMDLSDSGLKVLSIYGSEDSVLNMQKYTSCLVNLPRGYIESVIDGGCHAYFGSYGEQSGDGIPTISREEQIRLTVEAIADFVFGDS